jgi:hypothetical protein
MENEVMVYDDNIPAIADDNLLRVAEMAERRIDAVIKIKQMALKVTNANDWNDQGGKPYLRKAPLRCGGGNGHRNGRGLFYRGGGKYGK